MGLRRSWWTTAVVAVLVAGCGGSAGRAAPARTAVAPTTGLYDVSRSIVVSRLRPGEVVTISATTPRPDGLWSASATYTADGAGEVDLARVAPRSGSYRGVSATGLLWSQHLVRAGSAAARRTVTTLTVSAGEREVGSASISQALAAPSVTEHAEQLAKTGFVGRYFTPSGSARHPAVIVWGGSEGGLGASPSYAALLASHGIPALALAYFDEPGLPCALDDIPRRTGRRSRTASSRWRRAPSSGAPTRGSARRAISRRGRSTASRSPVPPPRAGRVETPTAPSANGPRSCPA